MTLNDEERDMVVAAIDSLATALTTYDHCFTIGEKCLVETSFEVLTGKKDLPRGCYFEREPDAGEEWKEWKG